MESIDKIKKIIVDQLGVDESKITEDSSFVDDLGADSLDIVELIMAFEEEFDMEIPDEDAEKIKTVGDAVKYLSKQEYKYKISISIFYIYFLKICIKNNSKKLRLMSN